MFKEKLFVTENDAIKLNLFLFFLCIENRFFFYTIDPGYGFSSLYFPQFLPIFCPLWINSIFLSHLEITCF